MCRMKYMFVHGLGQNASSWDKVIYKLMNRKNAVCPDLVSLITDKKCTYRTLYSRFAENCGETEELLSICGLSLGAVLALNFAIDNPEKVSSLVLAAPQYKMPKVLLKFQNIVFRFMPHTSFESTGFEKGDLIRLTASMENLNFSRQIKNISCPVLLLCGKKDKANRAAAIKLAHSLPNSELLFLEKSGHEVNVDAPEQMASVIHDFYKKHGLMPLGLEKDCPANLVEKIG